MLCDIYNERMLYIVWRLMSHRVTRRLMGSKLCAMFLNITKYFILNVSVRLLCGFKFFNLHSALWYFNAFKTSVGFAIGRP